MEINQVSGHVVDSSMRVHTVLGPGLLENAYAVCLTHELRKRGLVVLREHALPVEYDGVEIEIGYRVDLLVSDCVVVEVKAVNKLLPLHEAQLLSYLRLSGYKLGLLINFNVIHLKDGISRLVNGR